MKVVLASCIADIISVDHESCACNREMPDLCWKIVVFAIAIAKRHFATPIAIVRTATVPVVSVNGSEPRGEGIVLRDDAATR